MTNEETTYSMPNVGCMLGTAFYTLASQLASALNNAGLDITVSEYLILRALYAKSGLQQCEIAEMVGKDKGAVSRSVAAMVGKGIVRTEPVSYKCVRVYLTSKGLGLKDGIMSVARERHEALTTCLTEDEMKTFAKVLKIIIENKNKKG